MFSSLASSMYHKKIKLALQITYPIKIPSIFHKTCLFVCIHPTSSRIFSRARRGLCAFLKSLSMAELQKNAPRTSTKWWCSPEKKKNGLFTQKLRRCNQETSPTKWILFKEFYPRHLEFHTQNLDFSQELGISTEETGGIHKKIGGTSHQCSKKHTCEHLPDLITMPEVRNCDSQGPQRITHKTLTCKYQVQITITHIVIRLSLTTAPTKHQHHRYEVYT